MNDCINILEENLNLSYSLIGEVILMEKLSIDNRYNENDFFDKYIHVATILGDELEKVIYHYATNLNFFIDPFKKKDDFIKNLTKKDYKAIFITSNLLKDHEITNLASDDFIIYCIDKNTTNEFSSDNIKFIDIDKRSEYLKNLKELKIKISKNYKKRFYLEIIKQNHEIEFSNYLALKTKIRQLKQEV
jgi:hypothetical protein